MRETGLSKSLLDSRGTKCSSHDTIFLNRDHFRHKRGLNTATTDLSACFREKEQCRYYSAAGLSWIPKDFFVTEPCWHCTTPPPPLFILYSLHLEIKKKKEEKKPTKHTRGNGTIIYYLVERFTCSFICQQKICNNEQSCYKITTKTVYYNYI